MLSGVLNSHSKRAQEANAGCRLIARSAPLPQDPIVRLSDHMELNGKRISVGDFVLRGSSLGCVVACCSDGQDLIALVDTWRKVSEITQHSSKWDNAGSQRMLWRAADVQECVCWQRHPGPELTLIQM